MLALLLLSRWARGQEAYRVEPLRVAPLSAERYGESVIAQFPQGVTVLTPRDSTTLGVQVLAVEGVGAAKLLRVASVLAHYLDNDGDGHVDNPDVAAQLDNNGATMLMFANGEGARQVHDAEEESGESPIDTPHWMDVNSDETAAARSMDASKICTLDYTKLCDAVDEEVFHLVHVYGFAPEYPEVFGFDPEEVSGSVLEKAFVQLNGNCSYGRGEEQDRPPKCTGHFFYDDPTCDWPCNLIEAMWHSVAACNGQLSASGCFLNATEWDLCSLDQEKTREMVRAVVPDLYAAMVSPTYRIPLNMPSRDTYKASATTQTLAAPRRHAEGKRRRIRGFHFRAPKPKQKQLRVAVDPDGSLHG